MFAGCAAIDDAHLCPAKPVRVVVGFSPGGVADATVRLIAPRLDGAPGQQIIVENCPGSSGAIATERVAATPADGYTLLASTAADAVIPILRAKLPYRLGRDLVLVSLVAVAPFVLVVHPSVPARNVEKLIARARPGKLSYGSVGIGTTPHLSAEAPKVIARLNILHVPYKGGLDAVIANVSGMLDMVFARSPSLMPLLGADPPRLRALAVISAKRASFRPDLPSLSEAGIAGCDRSSWVSVRASAGVPKEIIAKLNASLNKVVNTAEVNTAFARQGLEAHTNTPEQFAAFVGNQFAQNAKLLRAIGLEPESV